MKFNDERTKKLSISTELTQRINRIDKLKHRYETLAMKLNTDQSDEENILHQAQHVIQVYSLFFVYFSREQKFSLHKSKKNY